MSASIYGTIDEEQICPKIWLMTLISVPLPSNLEARLCRNTLTPRPDSPFLRFSFSKTVLTMVPILLSVHSVCNQTMSFQHGEEGATLSDYQSFPGRS